MFQQTNVTWRLHICSHGRHARANAHRRPVFLCLPLLRSGVEQLSARHGGPRHCSTCGWLGGGAVQQINSKIASSTCQQPRQRRAVDRGADQGARCEAEGAACSKLPQEATECCIEEPEVDAPELHIARGIVHIICFRMPACFSATSKESLLSWSFGHRQFLWTYDPTPCWLAPGCEVRDASLLLPEEEFRYLETKGNIEHIQAFFALRALLECGGIYVAMDVLWLGRQLPMSEHAMWVAPSGPPVWQSRVVEAWASTVWSMACANKNNVAGCSSLPHTLDSIYYQLASNPQAAGAAVQCEHPYAVSLPERLYAPLSRDCARPTHTISAVHESFALRIWETYWPTKAIEETLLWARSVLASRRASHIHAFPHCDDEALYVVRGALAKHVQALLSTLIQLCDDMHIAYRAVADALAYLQSRGAMDIARLALPYLRLHTFMLSLGSCPTTCTRECSSLSPARNAYAPFTVEDVAVALLVVVLPTYLSSPGMASWRGLLCQSAGVDASAVDLMVPAVRCRVYCIAGSTPPTERPGKQWGGP